MRRLTQPWKGSWRQFSAIKLFVSRARRRAINERLFLGLCAQPANYLLGRKADMPPGTSAM
jgi:hypothetical protein